MKWLDRWFDSQSRHVARHTSRRSFLNRLGVLLVGAGTVPLLPMARASDPANRKQPALPGDPDPGTPQGDPLNCDYWRYCSIDGAVASCCGGSPRSCPPGTEMSPVAWIGTCRNPADGKHYIISYNDCCGKSNCSRCFCFGNEGDKPVYFPSKSNDTVWCMGKAGLVYNSTVAVVLGVATEPDR
jgi:methylamine dehydrogenase light chain